MSQTKTLLSVEIITDDETGMYSIGEFDYRICVGPVADYLREHGLKGRDELFKELSFLTCKVQEYFEEYGFKGDAPCEAKVID